MPLLNFFFLKSIFVIRFLKYKDYFVIFNENLNTSGHNLQT